MRLVYLYVSNGSTDQPRTMKWSPKILSREAYTHLFPEEGFCHLFRKFIKEKLFNEILVVIESSRSPGYFLIDKGITGLVVPHMEELNNFLYTDDIIWARGGWRSWHNSLQSWQQNHWLLFYRAASNRGAWPFWDIVLDDLTEECSQDGAGRFYYPINKPINPDLFKFDRQKINYDLMIGASHIHDKKGQYKIIPILLEYRKQFGKDLMCIMPGSMKRGTGTSQIIEQINKHNLMVHMPGMISHKTLCDFYNQSRLFVHLGGAGQNDRGPLEAMSCGTPVILANEKYHAPCITGSNTPYSFHVDADEPVLAARQIHYALNMIDNDFHAKVHRYFCAANGIDTVIYPQFSALFKRIFQIPHSEKQKWFDSLLNKEEKTECCPNNQC